MTDKKNLQEMVRKHLHELALIRARGATKEELLERAVHKGYLLHGSRNKITDNHIKARNGKIYATNSSPVAMLKAIISNREANIRYPYYPDEKHPLEVEIHSLQKDTIGTHGLIYLLNPNGFVNEPEGSWQYVTSEDQVPILGRISVTKEDFTYPIYDATGRKRVQ